MESLRVLGVIPARGGSKGVPNKNIRLLCGRPLLEYTAEAAQAAKRLSRVILTTDSSTIAKIGKDCGLEVPFLRPAELATDGTPSLPVLQHAVSWCESENDYYDAICLLQPTSPIRPSGLIDACIGLLDTSGSDAVVTTRFVPAEFNPHWVYFEDSAGRLRLSTGEKAPIPRRQELPKAYHRDGSVYLTRRDVLMEGNSLYGADLVGYPILDYETVSIDTESDWRRAELLVGSGEPEQTL